MASTPCCQEINPTTRHTCYQLARLHLISHNLSLLVISVFYVLYIYKCIIIYWKTRKRKTKKPHFSYYFSNKSKRSIAAGRRKIKNLKRKGIISQPSLKRNIYTYIILFEDIIKIFGSYTYDHSQTHVFISVIIYSRYLVFSPSIRFTTSLL